MAERQTMLKSTYDSIEEVPEEFRSLYSDVNGTVRLVGIAGVKTQADIDTLTKSLNEERLAHKATKERLSVWGDLKHEEVMQKLDKLPALEAASEGKFDEAAIEAAASKRAEGAIKMALGPVQRKADENAKKLEEALAEVQNLREEKVSRTISDEMRKAMAEAKVIPEAQEDVLLYARALFTVAEDGSVVTKDAGGVSPGLPPKVWLSDMAQKRPHWWPLSVGGGARSSSSVSGKSNPWSADGWNLTAQGAFLKEHGQERAKAMAEAAGTTLGKTRPPKKR
jgi:hypothetical protein